MNFKSIENLSEDNIDDLYESIIENEEIKISCGCWCGNYQVTYDVYPGYGCATSSGARYTQTVNCVNACASTCRVSSSRCTCGRYDWGGRSWPEPSPVC